MRHKQQVKFAPLPPPFKNFGNDNDSFAIFYLHWGNFSSKMWKSGKANSTNRWGQSNVDYFMIAEHKSTIIIAGMLTR